MDPNRLLLITAERPRLRSSRSRTARSAAPASALEVVEAADDAGLGRRVGRILLLALVGLGLADFLVRFLLALGHRHSPNLTALSAPRIDHSAERGAFPSGA